MGLREVTKHLKLNQLKCIIISPNMERIQSKGSTLFLQFFKNFFCTAIKICASTLHCQECIDVLN
jgi:hypothetical protein